LTPEDLIEVLEDATRARDLPGMADVDFSLFAFCKQIRQKVKVALSGECADEIFGGYPWFRDPDVRDADGFPWAQNTDIRVSMMEQYGDHGHEFVNDLYLDTLRDADILPGTSALERRMKEMVNLNMKWFMQTLLDRKDRMSMYHGLEVRVPFCDHRIAEYLYSVPWEFKDYMGKEKGLLRKAMEGILPEKVLWRKKNPYPKTHDPAYSAMVVDQLKELMSHKDAPLFAIVRRSAVQDLLKEEQIWPWYGQLMRRPQTMAFLLQLNAWFKMYKVSIV
jgi:asparagine synthase (glutamine-hydrolysing)